MGWENNRMLIIGALVILVIVVVIGGWQCQSCRQFRSHVVSGVTGLDRRVTLYAVNGSVIREWEGRYNVEVKGASARFIIEDGSVVNISGTFVVEENPKPRPKEKKEKK